MNSPARLRAPFPYFGGKSPIADEVWRRFGGVSDYIEPFAGSLAVLLARPNPHGREIVNDLDAFVVNFWRAATASPRLLAHAASYPIVELDLHARHDWMHAQHDIIERIRRLPSWFDARVAAWWVWGVSSAMGNSFHLPRRLRSIPRIFGPGNGIHRRSLELPDLGGRCRHTRQEIEAIIQALADRLRYVRVCCGDWRRVLTDGALGHKGVVGVFLDPPYAVKDRADVYACESRTLANDVRKWAVRVGRRRRVRIALCGYEGEHDMPPDWRVYAWSAHGGFGNTRKGSANDNRHRERVWFSPHCLE